MAPSSVGSPQKGRKGKKATSVGPARDGAVMIDSKTSQQVPAFPLVSFFWPARKAVSQWITLPSLLMVVALFKWAAGLWGYSGFGIPPMHGDFEAQRHWMELTTHLPISHWYFYDLQYWGLDYPPLTAYHSWLLGKIGSFINPSWFALYSSRGLEEQLLKVYMRVTVLVSEYLTYIPAAVILTQTLGRFRGGSSWESSIALTAILLQPATILVDNAHFQYNTVMLGFVLAAVSSLLSNRYAWACVFFVAALSFKQMALYFAPAIFAYLLGSCFMPKARPTRFLIISSTTVLTFAIVFAPILLGGLYDHSRGINPPLSLADRQVNPLMAQLTPYLDPAAYYYPALLQLTQIIHRVFPFARGIFEDKVANFWCCIHILHKLHAYPIAQLQRISSLLTLVFILPACMIIGSSPQAQLLLWSLASCAWGFFLWSFQVHEKSVLLPILPMTALLAAEGGLGVEMRSWIGWANQLAVWTMFPLLKRDELRMPYFILSLLWSFLLELPPTSLACYFGEKASRARISNLTRMIHLGFYVLMAGWHFAEAFIEPPKTKPDLWVVLNVVIGTAGFGIAYAWCTTQLVLRSGILDEWMQYRREQDGKSVGERAKALPLPWPLPKLENTSRETSSEPTPSPSKRKPGRPKKQTSS